MHIVFTHQVQAEESRFRLDISLRSHDARIALFGPSGAGKSLTAAVVAGLIRPQQGHIAIGGTVFLDSQTGQHLSCQQRRIAYLAQDYALFPHLTVGQNLAFGLSRGWRNPSRRASLPEAALRWVRSFGLQDLLHHYPGQISGGQRQRVALARALAISPRMLVLDEPLAALDIPLRHHLRAQIAVLQQELNIPSLLITHDPEDVRMLADRVFCMEQGRIVRECESAALF